MYNPLWRTAAANAMFQSGCVAIKQHARAARALCFGPPQVCTHHTAANMTSLLSQPRCRRGVAHLSGLVALEQLNLSENAAVRDAGLAGLSRLTRLASLDLSYTSALFTAPSTKEDESSIDFTFMPGAPRLPGPLIHQCVACFGWS